MIIITDIFIFFFKILNIDTFYKSIIDYITFSIVWHYNDSVLNEPKAKTSSLQFCLFTDSSFYPTIIPNKSPLHPSSLKTSQFFYTAILPHELFNCNTKSY